jgi:elongation factor Ts
MFYDANPGPGIHSQSQSPSYVHAGGKIGDLVEVSCESEFASRAADFQDLIHQIAMDVAASCPKFISVACKLSGTLLL